MVLVEANIWEPPLYVKHVSLQRGAIDSLASISAQAEVLPNVQFLLTNPVFPAGRGLALQTLFAHWLKLLQSIWHRLTLLPNLAVGSHTLNKGLQLFHFPKPVYCVQDAFVWRKCTSCGYTQHTITGHLYLGICKWSEVPSTFHRPAG